MALTLNDLEEKFHLIVMNSPKEEIQSLRLNELLYASQSLVENILFFERSGLTLHQSLRALAIWSEAMRPGAFPSPFNMLFAFVSQVIRLNDNLVMFL